MNAKRNIVAVLGLGALLIAGLGAVSATPASADTLKDRGPALVYHHQKLGERGKIEGHRFFHRQMRGAKFSKFERGHRAFGKRIEHKTWIRTKGEAR